MDKEIEIIGILNKYQDKNKPLHDEGVIDPMDFHKVAKDVVDFLCKQELNDKRELLINFGNWIHELTGEPDSNKVKILVDLFLKDQVAFHELRKFME